MRYLVLVIVLSFAYLYRADDEPEVRFTKLPDHLIVWIKCECGQREFKRTKEAGDTSFLPQTDYASMNPIHKCLKNLDSAAGNTYVKLAEKYQDKGKMDKFKNDKCKNKLAGLILEKSGKKYQVSKLFQTFIEKCLKPHAEAQDGIFKMCKGLGYFGFGSS